MWLPSLSNVDKVWFTDIKLYFKRLIRTQTRTHILLTWWNTGEDVLFLNYFTEPSYRCTKPSCCQDIHLCLENGSSGLSQIQHHGTFYFKIILCLNYLKKKKKWISFCVFFIRFCAWIHIHNSIDTWHTCLACRDPRLCTLSLVVLQDVSRAIINVCYMKIYEWLYIILNMTSSVI